MNRLLCFCAFWLCQLLMFAQSGTTGDDFNPNTPPNPDVPVMSHWLKFQSEPYQAGRFLSDSVRYKTGTKVYVQASANAGYAFDRWTENGQTVSTSMNFYYDMPDRDVTLTAVFHFDPLTPPNPDKPHTKHLLTLDAIPWQAGYFNWNVTSEILDEQPVEVCAYNRTNFKFVEWQQDGKVISKEATYSFVMPTTNVKLVAVYEYSPGLPGNPGANFYDPLTGEVIIDEFEPGKLSVALNNLLKNDLSKVKMLTVSGKMTSSDWSVISRCTQCGYVDMSRTSGANFIPDWTFEYMKSLVEVVLPSTISSISYYAFYGCSALERITCYAITPPTLRYVGGFYGIPTGIVVHVPSVALDKYRQAYGWKNFMILPLQSEMSALTVNLPANADISIYKNMYIELVNIKNGQKQRCVITNRSSYTFSNLIHNTEYNVYLVNNRGDVLGQIDHVKIADKDESVTFGSLLAPRDVILKVVTPDGQDVTGEVAITWTDEKGAFLFRGNMLASQLEGTKVRFHIALPQTLAMQYELPADSLYKVQAANNIRLTLKPIAQITISGTVRDLKTEQPIAGATVAASQMLNGLYSKAFTTKTDNQGHWSLKVYDTLTDLTASMVNYVSKSLTVEKLTAVIPDFELKDVNGTAILLNLTYTDANGVLHNGYDDWDNLTFNVYNSSYSRPITELNAQEDKIVLAETLRRYTNLRITVSSKNNRFKALTVYAWIDERDRATANINIKLYGSIKASYTYTENAEVVGILYDGSGRRIAQYDYTDKQLTISNLPDGYYTLITMSKNPLFNSIASPSQYSSMGLYQGSNYLRSYYYVSSGRTTTFSYGTVPYLDELKHYFTTSSTSFTVNKSSVTAGQYLTLNSRIDFKSSFKKSVSDVKLIVDLPETVSFVENSVLCGDGAGSYTSDDHRVIIPVTNFTDRIRFCIIPTAGGTYSASASVQFTLDGQVFTQPIGCANFTVSNLSLIVPPLVVRPRVPVCGNAVAQSSVKVFVDGLLLAQTKALASGAWATTIELDGPENKSQHTVYAVVTTPAGIEMQTETCSFLYDENLCQVTKVTMTNNTNKLVFDFLNPSVSSMKYSYNPSYKTFTFAIEFLAKDPQKLATMVLEARTMNGAWVAYNATYDKRKNLWVASGSISRSNDAFVSVRVRYVLQDGQSFLVSYPGPNASVAIDPSGYVYEAVSSNRVQGATATIYYKETVEDEYGDPHENIVLWDAEEYAQENPLFTDEEGMYQWDVPQGLWQVRIEKEGYLTTYSEWLPVPPPQLDVNLAITQMLQPAVLKASAFAEGIEMEFDKYMDPATLTADNIYMLRNGEKVECSISLPNEEVTYEGQEQTYASKVRLSVPKGQELLHSDKILLTVSRQVKSYAGLNMEQDYSQQLVVEPKVQTIAVDSLINVVYGAERKLTVTALPAEASKGKKLYAQSLATMIATIQTDTLLLDENGQAELRISGELPGSALLTFAVEGTDVEASMTVNVADAAQLTAKAPKASRSTGTEVYRGTQIQLTSETNGATIYYTLDGSEPKAATAIKYDDDTPIVIATDNVTIKAVATGTDLTDSPTATFKFTLKKAAINYQLSEGWCWISHNFEQALPASTFFNDAERIVGQTSEQVKDPVAGMVGNLTELLPTESYKLKLTAPATTQLAGYEYDAATNRLHLEPGWNWIGYPLSQTMTVADALAYHQAAEGDYIVGQDGYAEFAEGQWRGTLLTMKPGQGFLYKSAEGSELAYNTTPTLSGSRAESRKPSDVGQASSNESMAESYAGYTAETAKHAYPDVMPLTAQLYADGCLTTEGDYIVAAFAGSQCRGTGIWQDNRLLMSVYGQPGDDIRFIALQPATERCFDIEGQLAFTPDNVGSWNAPHTLTLGSETTSIQPTDGKISVTPLVARDHIVVTTATGNIGWLTLTDMSGRAVVALNDLGKGATIAIGQLPDGIYILSLQAGGQTCYKKILKANK